MIAEKRRLFLFFYNLMVVSHVGKPESLQLLISEPCTW